MDIKVKYKDGVIPIEKIEIGDWIDLRTAEDIEMVCGEYKVIPLGLAVELPKGYEAIIAPRSSTFKNYGLICPGSIGVIDNSYCGDDDYWNFPALCLSPKGTKIKKNERICQFRIFRNQDPIKAQVVDKLDGVNRGGIGSTGTR